MPCFDPSKPILVFLAGGVQGSAVVRAAAGRGYRVRALVRGGARTALPAEQGIAPIAADLDDPASLRRACQDVGAAVLQVPIGPMAQMCRQAQASLNALAQARVPALILRLASASRPAPCPEASFVANAAIEAMARAAGLPFAIVRPTLYLDNLLKPSARADLIAHGVFAPPIPRAQRVAWTSTADCAAATVSLLEQGVDGRDHRIAGAESLTGDALAAKLTVGLGRPIRYDAQPVAAFEREVTGALGQEAGPRVAAKFRYFERYPEEADRILAAPFDPRHASPGFRPTDVTAWVRRHREVLLTPG